MVWSTLMTQETTMCSPADHLWRVHPVGLVSLRWMGHEAKPNIFPNFIYKLDISSKAGTSQIKTWWNGIEFPSSQPDLSYPDPCVGPWHHPKKHGGGNRREMRFLELKSSHKTHGAQHISLGFSAQRLGETEVLTGKAECSNSPNFTLQIQHASLPPHCSQIICKQETATLTSTWKTETHHSSHTTFKALHFSLHITMQILPTYCIFFAAFPTHSSPLKSTASSKQHCNAATWQCGQHSHRPQHRSSKTRKNPNSFTIWGPCTPCETSSNLRRGDENQPPALLSLFRVELGSMLSDMYNPYRTSRKEMDMISQRR